MMHPLMSFRIVILNGVTRGERFEIDRSAITVGKGASCDIVLPESGISDIHAMIKPQSDELHISVMGPQYRLTVNKTETQEALLHHGDVVEIGTTRLFIQHHRSQTWETMTGYRKWRKWSAIILPVLLLSGIALTLNRCRSTPTPAPAPETNSSSPHTLVVSDPNNNDWIVTNIPQIQINPAIVLSSAPPDIVDATELFLQERTNNIQQEIDIALKELAFATEFLDQVKNTNPAPPFIPDTQASQSLLQLAEAALSIDNLTNSSAAETMITNPAPTEVITEPATNQIERLTN